jgi:hypothetical protein
LDEEFVVSTEQIIYGLAMALAGLLVWRFSVQYDKFLEVHREKTGFSMKGPVHRPMPARPPENDAPPSAP